jgi:hypothetical protein
MVVLMCAVGLRGVRRLRAVVRPRAQAAFALVVHVSGCAGTGIEVVTAHVVLAALGAGALTLAGALVGPGHSHALQLAGVLGVSALALHAVFVVARQYDRRHPLRPLLISALDRLRAAHGQLPAARVLAFACEPQRLWSELPGARELLRLSLCSALQASTTQLALARARRLVPGLGPALKLMDAGEAALLSARFVRELALAASDVHCRLVLAVGAEEAESRRVIRTRL